MRTAIEPSRTRIRNSFAASPQRAGGGEPVMFVESIIYLLDTDPKGRQVSPLIPTSTRPALYASSA